MSLFTSIQTECAAELNAKTFFTAAPAISVLYENLLDITSQIETALLRIGLGVIIKTPQAKNGTPFSRQPPVIDNLTVAARIIENPTINRATGGTLQPALLVLEAVMWNLQGFAPASLGNRLMFIGYELVDDPDVLIYEASFRTGGNIKTAPVRAT